MQAHLALRQHSFDFKCKSIYVPTTTHIAESGFLASISRTPHTVSDCCLMSMHFVCQHDANDYNAHDEHDNDFYDVVVTIQL